MHRSIYRSRLGRVSLDTRSVLDRYIDRCYGEMSLEYRPSIDRYSIDTRPSRDRYIDAPTCISTDITIEEPHKIRDPQRLPTFCRKPTIQLMLLYYKKVRLFYTFIFFFFSGVVSIDVELSSIDINQCDAEDPSATDSGGRNGKSDRTGSTDPMKLVDFLGTHKCKPSTQVRTKRAYFNIKGFLLVNHVMKQLTIRELEALSICMENPVIPVGNQIERAFPPRKFFGKKEYL